MTVVKINAIDVPAGMGAELEKRFAARADEVDKQPGFVSFELLRPTDGNSPYYVVTHWESDEAFQAWMASRAFGEGHARSAGPQGPVSTGATLLEFEVVDFEAD